MVHRRNWSQWLKMHWIIGISVAISESDTRIFRIESTRWYLLAFCHMLYIESKYKTEYPYCRITTWMDWKS